MKPSTSSAQFVGQSAADDLMDDWVFFSTESAVSQGLEESRDDQEAEDTGRFKDKLVSAWNSVKYGWTLKQKSKFSKRSPVFMLGKSYELKDEVDQQHFRCCFASLLWFTYRRGFRPLPGSSLTTDSGWGCVLRSSQMLLAQGLLLHLMPPGCTWSGNQRVVKDDMDLIHSVNDGFSSSERESKISRHLSWGSILDRPVESTHRMILRWFADNPTAPFGIHRLVELGKSSGKKAGDWYGPSIAAHILRKAVEASVVDLPNLVVYVAQDCTIYLQDVRKLCERPNPQHWKSVLILVPVRLGGQDLNPSYITSVKKLLMLECCIGIIGGKPKHSLFFVGFQENHLLYLDPHYCQPTVDVTNNFPLESFHCKNPRKMPFSRMDPSCTIGFYAKGQMEFESLCTSVNEAVSASAETYPMFIFEEGKTREEARANTPTHSVTFLQRKTQLGRVDTNSSMDEFVLL
ncbi:cysteine protease ATG4D-like isoform X1 [Neolamprologus brichardi]|uniref:cysteine protease ATG4D-like isoform X1 n=2 Tax=Neolamprologus brichardi TaxID=32507 RepID=UPI0003EBDBDB|nr:cysteine protease ATG4D-like isoform X1 [Neolamprologus brichardi]